MKGQFRIEFGTIKKIHSITGEIAWGAFAIVIDGKDRERFDAPCIYKSEEDALIAAEDFADIVQEKRLGDIGGMIESTTFEIIKGGKE